MELINVLILSTLASLATAFGGLLAMIKKPGDRMFGFMMGFAAGVMITISFLKLILEAWKISGPVSAILGFTVGSSLMFLLDSLLPHTYFSVREEGVMDGRLFKVGVLIAIGMALHNMPEGVAVVAGYLHLPALGLMIAIAIALHNIPEGIAVALPLRESGASRLTSLKLAFASGCAEPLGALFATPFLWTFSRFMPIALAFAGGVMIFLTLDELVPVAYEHGHKHSTSIGLIIGSVVMLTLMGIFGI